MVESMSKQVKRILKARAREEAHRKVSRSGEVIEYIDNVYPTDTNILAACAMVADRIEPIIHQTANLNVNVECSPVDLGRWGGCGSKVSNDSHNLPLKQEGDNPLHLEAIDMTQEK
jgi:hypothetical protein